jgi:hypothetical protein
MARTEPLAGQVEAVRSFGSNSSRTYPCEFRKYNSLLATVDKKLLFNLDASQWRVPKLPRVPLVFS